MKPLKRFVDRNFVFGEDKIAYFINKYRSEYLIRNAAYNDDLGVETIQEIFYNLNNGLISSVQRPKCIDFNRKSRV